MRAREKNVSKQKMEIMKTNIMFTVERGTLTNRTEFNINGK